MCRFLLSILLLACLSAPASAQIYKYSDKTGGVRYADDISRVPEDQQAAAERHAVPEIQSPPAAVPAPPQLQPVPDTQDMKKAAEPEKDSAEQARALEKEHQELMAEKERIEKEIETYSKRYKTRSRKGVARKKLQELELQKAEWDQKFQDYESRKEALDVPGGDATAK